MAGILYNTSTPEHFPADLNRVVADPAEGGGADGPVEDISRLVAESMPSWWRRRTGEGVWVFEAYLASLSTPLQAAMVVCVFVASTLAVASFAMGSVVSDPGGPAGPRRVRVAAGAFLVISAALCISLTLIDSFLESDGGWVARLDVSQKPLLYVAALCLWGGVDALGHGPSGAATAAAKGAAALVALVWLGGGLVSTTRGSWSWIVLASVASVVLLAAVGHVTGRDSIRSEHDLVPPGDWE